MAETQAAVALNGGLDALLDFENHVENRDYLPMEFLGQQILAQHTSLHDIIIFFNVDTLECINSNKLPLVIVSKVILIFF